MVLHYHRNPSESVPRLARVFLYMCQICCISGLRSCMTKHRDSLVFLKSVMNSWEIPSSVTIFHGVICKSAKITSWIWPSKTGGIFLLAMFNISAHVFAPDAPSIVLLPCLCGPDIAGYSKQPWDTKTLVNHLTFNNGQIRFCRSLLCLSEVDTKKCHHLILSSQTFV